MTDFGQICAKCYLNILEFVNQSKKVEKVWLKRLKIPNFKILLFLKFQIHDYKMDRVRGSYFEKKSTSAYSAIIFELKTCQTGHLKLMKSFFVHFWLIFDNFSCIFLFFLKIFLIFTQNVDFCAFSPEKFTHYWLLWQNRNMPVSKMFKDLEIFHHFSHFLLFFQISDSLGLAQGSKFKEKRYLEIWYFEQF